MTGWPIEHWNRPSFINSPLTSRLKSTILTDKEQSKVLDCEYHGRILFSQSSEFVIITPDVYTVNRNPDPGFITT